jgi:uncharacterized protein with HEPN domain
MPRDPKKFLDDILHRARRAIRVAGSRERNELIADEVVWLALERDISIIGEAVMQLHRLDPATAERIQRWRDIIGCRHILVHGYDELDPEVLCDIIKTDLPVLVVQVESLLLERG